MRRLSAPTRSGQSGLPASQKVILRHLRRASGQAHSPVARFRFTIVANALNSTDKVLRATIRAQILYASTKRGSASKNTLPQWGLHSCTVKSGLNVHPPRLPSTLRPSTVEWGRVVATHNLHFCVLRGSSVRRAYSTEPSRTQLRRINRCVRIPKHIRSVFQNH